MKIFTINDYFKLLSKIKNFGQIAKEVDERIKLEEQENSNSSYLIILNTIKSLLMECQYFYQLEQKKIDEFFEEKDNFAKHLYYQQHFLNYSTIKICTLNYPLDRYALNYNNKKVAKELNQLLLTDDLLLEKIINTLLEKLLKTGDDLNG